MKITELITDPASQQLSMSRLCLPVTLAIDLAWMIAVVMQWPDPKTVSPVSEMLKGVSWGVCGIYGASTIKGAVPDLIQRARAAFGGE